MGTMSTILRYTRSERRTEKENTAKTCKTAQKTTKEKGDDQMQLRIETFFDDLFDRGSALDKFAERGAAS